MGEKSSKTKGSIYKTILLGESSVGKTQLKRRYLGLDFSDTYIMTRVSELSVKRVENGAVQIWDLSGNLSHKDVNKKYMKETQSAIFVFDLTKSKSVVALKKWIDIVIFEKGTHIPCIIVGNKKDLCNGTPEKSIRNQALDYARDLSYNSVYEVPYIETSAKTELNIDYLFEYLINEIQKM